MSSFAHPSQWLPPPILALFEPGPPIQYLPPEREKKPTPISPLSQYVDAFEDPETAPPPPEWQRPLTRLQKQEMKAREKREHGEKLIREGLKSWDPHSNPSATEDPFKTLFVARLSYSTTEEELKREFEHYGPIKTVNLIRDSKTGKSRGYAFIEYERLEDMKEAFKYSDERMIDGRRVKVDVERGRVEKNWRPRRLGGGLGGESRLHREVIAAAVDSGPAPRPSYGGDRGQRSSYGGGGGGGPRRGGGGYGGDSRYRPYGSSGRSGYDRDSPSHRDRRSSGGGRSSYRGSNGYGNY